MTETVVQQDPVIEKILAVIDEHVRPYIEMDGGKIDFVRYTDNIVYVRLSGACGTCPSSTVTLKGGVERNLRRRIPEIQSVEMEGLEAPIDPSSLPPTIIRL